MPTAVLVPIKETNNSTAFYHVFLLAVELVLVLTFLSLSVLIFFFCLEVILLLTYLLLYYWGSRLRKIRSSFYLLIFTILGSSLLLTGILFLLQIAGSTDLTLMDNFHFSVDQSRNLSGTIFPILSPFQRASHCVADLKPSEGQLDLDDVLRPGRGHDCVDVEANEPLYVLHTSGTTGG